MTINFGRISRIRSVLTLAQDNPLNDQEGSIAIPHEPLEYGIGPTHVTIDTSNVSPLRHYQDLETHEQGLQDIFTQSRRRRAHQYGGRSQRQTRHPHAIRRYHEITQDFEMHIQHSAISATDMVTVIHDILLPHSGSRVHITADRTSILVLCNNNEIHIRLISSLPHHFSSPRLVLLSYQTRVSIRLYVYRFDFSI